MKSKMATFLVAACVALASCGGDDSGSSSDGLSSAVSDALTASMSEDAASFGLDEDNVECMTAKLIEDEDIGPALQAAFDEGNTGEDLLGAVDADEDMGTKATLITLQCMTVEQIVDVIIAERSEVSEITDEQRSCLIDELGKFSQEELGNSFAALAGIVEDDDAANAFNEAQMKCFGFDM